MAERIFYARGIQAVGMARLRSVAGVPMKRIYELFPSKDALVVRSLRRRHERMMSQISSHIKEVEDPQSRVLGIFDWLHQWFSSPDFRGCPWMNAYGELGPTNPAIAAEVHHHQRDFRALLTAVPTAAGYSQTVSSAIYLLVEGAVAAAAIEHTPRPAAEARAAAEALLLSEKPDFMSR